MLPNINLDDKTYDDVLKEAVNKVTVLTSEWTDFNDSDPGVTILQNLSAFSILEQSKINIVTEKTRLELLKLVDIRPEKSTPARILLSPIVKEDFSIAPLQRFMLGTLCYETQTEVAVSKCSLETALIENNGIVTDITHLVTGGNIKTVAIFTKTPEEGDSLLLVLNSPPTRGSHFILHFTIAEEFPRQPFVKDGAFATFSFEILCEEGFVEVPFVDKTNTLLTSGSITLLIPDKAALYSEEKDGYVIKCTLQSVQYDVAPLVSNIDVGLFEVVQRHTMAKCFSFDGSDSVLIDNALVRFDNLTVLVCEEEGAPYKLYNILNDIEEIKGRYCVKTIQPNGSVELLFDKDTFGYAPTSGTDMIKVICYDDVAVVHRKLGVMYGYEDQIMDIDIGGYDGDILEDSFEILAESFDTDVSYLVIKNGDYGVELEIQGNKKLCIHSNGELDAATFYIASVAVTSGSRGNVRANNTFKAVLGDGETAYFNNPSVGIDGKNRDTIEQMIRTFEMEIKEPVCAVLESDIERLVMQTPSLCIHKVKAVANSENIVVTIAIKPYSDREKLPLLSQRYSDEILAHLEPHRMLTTRFELISPIYVPFTVMVSVKVNSYYSNAKETVTDVIIKALDYVNSDKKFENVIYNSEVVKEIAELSCVNMVLRLNIVPESHGKVLNGNVYLEDFVLGYVRECIVEIR